MITTKMRVLVTVKAYPALSRRYGETVCVAGAQVDTELRRWIRLYPVGYRELPRDDQFQKYQLVDLEVSKASDGRPESYRPNLQSMRQGEVLPAGGHWARRWQYLSPLAGATTAS